MLICLAVTFVLFVLFPLAIVCYHVGCFEDFVSLFACLFVADFVVFVFVFIVVVVVVIKGNAVSSVYCDE